MNLSNKKFFTILLALLIIFSNVCSDAYAKKSSDKFAIIQFQSTDGFNLIGDLVIPKKASRKNKVQLVIFAHALGRSKDDWSDLLKKVQGLNVATLNLDLRGHGQSILNANEKLSYWRNYSDKTFVKYPDDIKSAIKYIKDFYPEIDSTQIALIGANIGANASIVAAKSSKENVKALVLLSPTLEYKGIKTPIALLDYGEHPILLMASEKDKFTYEDCKKLIKYAQGNKVFKIYSFGGNGLDLIKFQPDSQDYIINWLSTQFINIKPDK
ncbi:MAG: alpha/beta hydrolase [Candidatus Gastranaerophilales bacterium]|nr:alpha/beta hydrolase [Candidatus Gastranaerophilales bacterium]